MKVMGKKFISLLELLNNNNNNGYIKYGSLNSYVCLFRHFTTFN